MELNLQKQIGQLFMVGFDATEVDAHIARMIQQYHVGGVILFRRNVESPQQVARLCRDLQELNAKVSEIPLLIAIDQEGGMVMRVEQGVTAIPSAMAFQEAGSERDCEQLMRVSGEEMRAIGINMILAPVLDVNNNPLNPVIGVRAFGEDAETVIQFGMAALHGLQNSGVVATAKHFPGHGDTLTDSHFTMPVVGHDMARLNSVELRPFKAAIAEGVPAIMTAHVVFPAIEHAPDLPATLSQRVLTGLLRNELGFKGVIVTDCLEMAAISDGVGVAQGAVATLQAGSDLVLISHLEDRQASAVERVVSAVASGEISAQRMEQALQRILELKQTRAVANWRNAPLLPVGLMKPEALDLSRRVHKASLRVMGDFHPLRPTLPIHLITVELLTRTEVDETVADEEHRQSMLAAMVKAGLEVSEYRLPFNATHEELTAALRFTARAEQIVIQSYNAVLSAAQQKLLAALPHDKLWLVAGRLPYDLDLVPDARARLANFSCRPDALLPVVEMLTGQTTNRQH